MSIISNSMAPRVEVLIGIFFGGVGRALKNWWSAYINWRLEQLAISRLRAMSDRELKDIGVSRATIEFAVKGAFEPSPMLTRYY